MCGKKKVTYTDRVVGPAPSLKKGGSGMGGGEEGSPVIYGSLGLDGGGG